MNVGDFGTELRFGTGFNMALETSLTFLFVRPDCSTFSRTGQLGTTAVSTTVGRFAANTWAFYYFLNGDLTLAGPYQVRLVFNNSSATPPQQLSSNYAVFEVGP